MLRTWPDYESLSHAVAALIVERAARALRERGSFGLTLAGGSTPRRAYELLAGPACARRIDWRRVHVFWGDERCVPPDDPRSNYGMANAALLSRVPIPAANVHRIRGELPAAEAAAEYDRVLRAIWGAAPPAFELVLLGLGDDGHTASLFPHDPALRESQCWAAAVRRPGDPVARVTLTPPALNGARAVAFIVSGASKAAMLRAVREGPPDAGLPAQAIAPTRGELLWLVDAAAHAGGA
ncbi:MAG: 6-phosphogluconolactonase [Phycisphaerae bacterium]|jgi:6-phosphogluconolactonase|nr:6-phosphogluconolactonase [Phycisphaerae bacterium]MCZ2399168.1 6-phosphogluconolactonase [Phycisphaerae bacterium]